MSMNISYLPKSATGKRTKPQSKACHKPNHSLDLTIECPLLNPKLPPVTDMEHNLQNCFCYMCTCSKHICPGDYRLKAINPSNHFKTNYKIYYKKPVLVKNSAFKHEDHYSKQEYQTENKTTSQLTYIPHNIEAKEKNISNSRYNSPFRFRGKSTYKSEYKN